MKKCFSIVGLALALVLSSAGVGGAEETVDDAVGASPTEVKVSPGRASDTIKLVPGEFSATVGFTNDYVFRGLSQTDNGAAIQGSIDWAHESGFYLGVWGSNVDFNDNDGGSLEADLYAGYAGDLKGFSYDLQFVYYAYPGADSDLDYDYYEGVLGLGYDFGFASFAAGLAYSPETFGKGGRYYHYHGGISVPLKAPFDLTLNGNIGRSVFDEGGSAPDYNHYDVGLGASVLGFDLGVSYTDTDLSSSQCGRDSACKGKVLVSISRSF